VLTDRKKYCLFGLGSTKGCYDLRQYDIILKYFYRRGLWVCDLCELMEIQGSVRDVEIPKMSKYELVEIESK
jgi:hypothetical protein